MFKKIILCSLLFTAPIISYSYNNDISTPNCVAATEVSIDLDKLNEKQAATVLKLKNEGAAQQTGVIKEAMPEIISTIDDGSFDRYVNTIVSAITTLCHDLGIEVNEFIKSPAGLLITALVIFNFGGNVLIDTIISIFTLIPTWLILTGMFIWSYKRSVTGTIIKHKDGTKEMVHPLYEDASEKGVAQILHIIVYLIITLIIFVNIL